MKKMKKEFGKHYIVELIDCDPGKMKFVDDVKKIFLKAAKESRATVLKSFFHQFKPHGVSGVIMIAESHFSIHTWPEEKYASLDILTCGEMDAAIAIKVMHKGFGSKDVRTQVITRGF